MSKSYLSRRALQQQLAKGHAVANELDILVSMTLQLNHIKHNTTKKLRKVLRGLERKMRHS